MESSRENGKDVARWTLFFTGVFLLVFGVTFTRSAFSPPSLPPPADPTIPALDTGPLRQDKAGNLGAQNFFIARNNCYASIPPPVQIKFGEAAEGTLFATAHCDPGYKLAACSGARQRDANYTTCNEDNCEYVGTVPIDANDVVSYTNPNGCRTGIDPHSGAQATVHAYCIADQNLITCQ